MRTKKCMMMAIGVVMISSMGWAGEPPKDRISMEQAEKKATETYSGQIESKELEYEHGKWIYSFDIHKAGKKLIHEVQIDAKTGQVVSHTTENAKKEADEKTQEKN